MVVEGPNDGELAIGHTESILVPGVISRSPCTLALFVEEDFNSLVVASRIWQENRSWHDGGDIGVSSRGGDTDGEHVLVTGPVILTHL